MPTGMSWATYLKMFAASLLTMCAGTEVVHRYHQQDNRNLKMQLCQELHE
uniref:Uncharacterized protein n=2 Tax=Canis lupus familiaris TaxID=9615 RepID=A0A8C0MLQ3_CANLF